MEIELSLNQQSSPPLASAAALKNDQEGLIYQDETYLNFLQDEKDPLSTATSGLDTLMENLLLREKEQHSNCLICLSLTILLLAS